MGKGYNNYMCKKPFHPGSKANIKRAWMAEQKTESDQKRQEELRQQYEKEQDLYNNRALISKDSKDKLALNFMYEPPPGAKKERQREDDEPEYKFEWQRKYNAPREDYARGNCEIRDQPFGIQVRNVRCIKCHKWGHINTDKECPLFNKSGALDDPANKMDPSELMKKMKEEEGLQLKAGLLGPSSGNRSLITEPDNEEDDPEIDFLKSLSTKQKKKLLQKLEKIDKNKGSSHKKKKRKRKETSSESDSDSDSSDEDSEPRRKKHKREKHSKKSKKRKSEKSKKRRKHHHHHKKRRHSSSSSSDSTSS